MLDREFQPLCESCSAGKLEHAHERVDDSTSRMIGIAGASDAIRTVMEPLIEAMTSALIESIDCALPAPSN